MSETHTPGPWVATARTNAHIDIDAPGQHGYGATKVASTSLYKHEANARLIAAAPDLLEALKAILPFIPNTSASEGGASKYSENVRAADKVRAAIAKATNGGEG
jgi:hypothetical protein